MREVFFFPLFEKSGAKTFYCAHRIRDGREGLLVGRKAAARVCVLPRAGAAPSKRDRGAAPARGSAQKVPARLPAPIKTLCKTRMRFATETLFRFRCRE